MIEASPDCPLSGSGADAGPLERYEADHRAMGTVFTLAAYGGDAAYLEEVADRVFQEIDWLDDQMSRYKPASDLSGINREAARRPVLVEPGLFKLIQDSFRYSQKTDGAFDMTAGPLMKAWGFFRGEGRLPGVAELRAVMKSVGYRHVHLDEGARTIRFDAPGVELDLGGIGKGYAVDRAVGVLLDNGIQTALISSGTSSIFALGSPPGQRGWRISVRDPAQPDRSAAILRLENISLSVSGNYEKFFSFGGKMYAHIVDPRTGSPAEGVLSAAVISPSATEAEALSTAFFVAGAEKSAEYVKSNPNLIAILHLPGKSESSSEGLVVRSRTMEFPPGVLADVLPQ